MTRPFKKWALVAIILALTIIDPSLSAKMKHRFRRDTSGHFHPELHGDGAQGHIHSVHLHTHDGGSLGGLSSISASSSTGRIDNEHSHEIAASTFGQAVSVQRGYSYDGPPEPIPVPPPDEYPIQPNCGCVQLGRCDKTLHSYTQDVLRTTETIVCGTDYNLCCYPDPWPGVTDAFRHLAPCVPSEKCAHGYGTEATDVAFFGVIGPCPGLGTVRCMDRIAPVISAIPIPSEGPTHFVIPILGNSIASSPPGPVLPELPLPTTVYEPPGAYNPPEPAIVYNPPATVIDNIPVPDVVTPGIYNPPPVIVYNPPAPVPEPPQVVYNPPAPVTEPPPVVYNPPAPVTEPPPVVYNPPAPVTEPPPVVYNPPAPVTEPPPVVYNPPAPVTEPPPVVYNPPAPVTEPTVIYEPPKIYAAPIPVVEPIVTYAAPHPVELPITTYGAPTPVVEPSVTYGIPGTSYGEPLGLNNYLSNTGRFGSFGGGPFGYGGYRGYGGYYPGFYNSGFGFRKHFGFSKGFGFFG